MKARRIADEKNEPSPAENDFRYPGPKPQFREAALVFIADSVEAAGRSIQSPSQQTLDEMVRRIIRNKFVDGQLDECDLTLRDLDAIAKAMTRILVAIHHTRPQYPSQQDTTTLPRSSTTSVRTVITARAEPASAAEQLPATTTEHDGHSHAGHAHADVSDAPIDLSDHRRRLR